MMARSLDPDLNSLKAYHLLKVANAHFGKAPQDLGPDEKGQIDVIAQRSMMLESLVLASVEAQGVVVPDENLTQAFEAIAKNYPSKKELQANLKASSLTEDILRQALHRELLVEAVMDRVVLNLPKTTAEEAQAFYTTHQERFDLPERREAAHILITLNDDYAENSRTAATKRIEEILQRLDKGEDFAELAKQYSECPTALEGGVLGKVAPGKLYPELEAALFSMDEGDFQGPIETEIGLHIIKCVAIDQSGMVPFDEVSAKIIKSLDDQRAKAFKRQWLQSLKAAVKARQQ